MPVHRLATSSSIRAVFASRTSAHGAAAVVHVRRRADLAPARVAVVAGKKVGGAVARNRAKRRLREALRMIVVPDGTDVVVVARANAGTAAFTALRAELATLLRAATGDRARRSTADAIAAGAVPTLPHAASAPAPTSPEHRRASPVSDAATDRKGTVLGVRP